MQPMVDKLHTCVWLYANGNKDILKMSMTRMETGGNI